MNIVVRCIAIVLSAAAGLISVFGLASVFSGSYWEVVAVAAILEMAKLATAAWLHKNWNDTSIKLKTYLSIAVVVLMAITALGVYGFFARAHIEQQATLASGEASQIPLIQSRIAMEKSKLADVETSLSNIDTALTALSATGNAKDAQRALDAADKQRKEKKSLALQKATIQENIVALEVEKTKLDNMVKKQEVEVGPLKYLANLYYGNANTEQLEVAVRFLILTIVLVFDPLAVALLLASNQTKKPERKIQIKKAKKNIRRKKRKPSQVIRDNRVVLELPPVPEKMRRRFISGKNVSIEGSIRKAKKRRSSK